MYNLKEASKVLKSLSEENRLRIVLMLLKRDMCVCEINQLLNIALSTISAHLKNLKYAGIIEDSKDGRWVVYKLTEDPNIREIVNFLYKKLKDDELIKKDLEMVDKVSRYPSI